MSVERQYFVEGRAELEVRIGSGRIDLKPSSDGTVKVEVDTDDLDLTVEQRGNQVMVTSGQKSRRWSTPPAYVVVEIPEHADILIHTASANLDARVPLRKVDFKSASGDVEVGDVETLVVKTASGSVTASRVSESMRVNAVSGNVRVTESLNGSAVIVSVSGDTRIEDSDASLDISTVSGNATVGRFVGRNAAFKTVSGDVEFSVPPGTKAHLDTDLRTGRVSLPGTPPPTKEVLREMSVKARSVSGDLTINRTET